jgi:hypothetical protein
MPFTERNSVSPKLFSGMFQDLTTQPQKVAVSCYRLMTSLSSSIYSRRTENNRIVFRPANETQIIEVIAALCTCLPAELQPLGSVDGSLDTQIGEADSRVLCKSL